MSDQELAAVTGQGTTNLYIEENTVRLFLDVHIETYGTIASAMAGRYEKSSYELRTLKNHINASEIDSNWCTIKDIDGNIIIQGTQGIGLNTNTQDWDMSWQNVTLGESTEAPLVIDGLVIRTEFDDLSAPTKTLKRIMVGTNNMVGTISGDFSRTSGAIHPSVPQNPTGLMDELENRPVVLNRDSLLQKFESLLVDGGFFLDINLDGTSQEKGIRTIIGYQEAQAISMTFSGTEWWDN